MPRNYFTEEDITELSKSIYVKSISKANVQFTKEFKERFMELYRQGNTPKQILTMLDINPSILGKDRIGTLSGRIRKQSSRPEGFSRKLNSSKGKKRKMTFNTPEEELAYFKEYATLLEQELEFRKKLEALEEKELMKSTRGKNSK